MNTKHAYEYGPEIKVPEGGHIELSSGAIIHIKNSFRIATPKPKREFVVGKWYRHISGNWMQCVFAEGDYGWLRRMAVNDAYRTPLLAIDWSTPPLDEAP